MLVLQVAQIKKNHNELDTCRGGFRACKHTKHLGRQSSKSSPQALCQGLCGSEALRGECKWVVG
jgi:hypothetical protein